MTVSQAVGSAFRSVRWYITNLMGDSAYATYVEHHRATRDGTIAPRVGGGCTQHRGHRR